MEANQLSVYEWFLEWDSPLLASFEALQEIQRLRQARHRIEDVVTPLTYVLTIWTEQITEFLCGGDCIVMLPGLRLERQGGRAFWQSISCPEGLLRSFRDIGQGNEISYM